MREEEIVEETHRVRREISAQFHDDVHEFFEYLRQREAKRPDQVVTLDHVPPEPAAAAGARPGAETDDGRLTSRGS
ncbi:MAG: hypothetical protein ACXW5J_03640 [Thermoanaerobaculia bacterium]